ncbi:ceramide synthase 3 [Meleagris gallopavo]|uniref:ceramide synthase 3 n=1 Tax=Meleagris gallopavo TaxID=9103 RepID=UPI000549CD6B|nr:ceramide synthase 3 [Meleagris gallopavo]
MAHILKTLNSWFWWENIWMPINCTWADFVDRDGLVFPKPQQLYVTIPYAFVLLIIRFFTERYVAIPLAKALGIKNVRRVKPQPNPVLESYFRECSRHPSQSEIQGLAKKCNCTVHLVEKWFRRRRNLEIPTVLRKFQEAFWRFSFYFASSIAGFIFLYDKPWFYDIWQTWVGYPFQAAKMFNYARWEKTCNMLFFIFSIAFFITRIILFPFWILRATLYQPTFYSTTPVIAYFLFNGQLLILQGLHLYWGYLIFKILKRFIFLKDLKDDRSDEEEEDSVTDNEEESTKNSNKNGCGSGKHLLTSGHH